MSTPLLVVDVQQGFLNEFTRHLPGRIGRLIDAGDFDPVLFTSFVNSPHSPYHRFLEWHDCACSPQTDLAPELTRFAADERTFTKPGLAGLPDQLANYFKEHQTSEVVIVGIDTDMCVLKIAMDVFDRGIRPVVMTDCCASTAGLQAHLAGLAVLSRNIGAHQLRDAGLSDGLVAAPAAGKAAQHRPRR